jgi:hypothetical protein
MQQLLYLCFKPKMTARNSFIQEVQNIYQRGGINSNISCKCTKCQAAHIEIYKNMSHFLIFKIWSPYSNLFMAFGHKHDKTRHSHQGTPYARFSDKQYGLWAWLCDSIHCSLSGMHWDSQQYTVIQVQWAGITLITSFRDGENGYSLWNIG